MANRHGNSVFEGTSGSLGHLTSLSMLYPTSEEPTSRSSSFTRNFENGENALGSSIPPVVNGVIQPHGYSIYRPVLRSRELSPRSDLLPRRRVVSRGNIEHPDLTTSSMDPVDKHLFRSNTIPRCLNYGSAFYETSFTPEDTRYSSPRNHNLTPTRPHSLTERSIYTDTFNKPIFVTPNSNRNNRRNRPVPARSTVNRPVPARSTVNRPVPPRSTVSNVRYNTGWPNTRNFTHRIERTQPKPWYSNTRIDSFPTTDLGTSGPVNLYTYSDDEKEDKQFKPINFPLNRDISEVKVKEIDCHVNENARVHHTDKFAKTKDNFLIVRRGHPFRVSMCLNKLLSDSDYNICLEFSNGPSPQPGKGTFIQLSSATPVYNSESWSMQIDSIIDNNVNLSIEPAPTAIVGEWTMAFSVYLKGSATGNKRLKKEVHFYLLFNPWNRDDDVYFPDENKLSEYILNDSGCIFTGGYDQISVKPWFYGQFEAGILEAAIYCTKKGFNMHPRSSMGDPVRLSRRISKIVNSNDDNGIVFGNWSGNYSDGTAPLAWVGSVSILRRYIRTGRPVKYGQCFVFAGVVTTICRALGIPTRTVTNFSSAHDTDGSVTVDVHWDMFSNSDLSSVNTDSVWNFHVWNDVWMKRKDLAAGNDGWQVLDSTPQETSDGEFMCGPAPLTALLNGKCDVNYDTSFIYAEVNADRVHWGKQTDGSWKVIDVEKAIVGKAISTKTPDGLPLSDNLEDCEKYRVDITHQYKYIEGSERERMSVLAATHSAPRGYKRVYKKDNDLKFAVLPPKSVQIGSDFDVVMKITNSSGVEKSLRGRMLCEVTKYTGVAVHMCRNESFSLDIGAYEQQKLVMHITVDKYMNVVAEAAMFRFAMICRENTCGDQFSTLQTFRLRLPDLNVKMRDKFLRAGVPSEVKVGFTNPFKANSLTNCLVLAECPGMEDDKAFTTRDVMSGELFKTYLQITPCTRGTFTLFVTFNCDQIHGIKGTCAMFVD